MAANALTTETIALTEKKMDMALGDIIKMSKKASFKGKQAPRTSNKSKRFLNDRGAQHNPKGVLAKRRTSFKGNQFPVITEAARRAAIANIRNRVVYPSKQRFAAVPIQRNTGAGNIAGKKPKTLDALFSDMKEQRIRTISQQIDRSWGQSVRQSRVRGGRQQQRGRIGALSGGSGTRACDRFGNFIRSNF